MQNAKGKMQNAKGKCKWHSNAARQRGVQCLHLAFCITGAQLNG
jgi:hypothetical protein